MSDDRLENGDPHICERHEIADGRALPSCDDCRLVTDGGTTADGMEHADPCVKHRCGLCHQLFDSAIHGANCPDCGGAAFCTFTEEGCR